MAAFEAGSGADQGDEVADSTSLKTMASAAAALPAPLVTFVLSRTVAKVDSMGFVVRK